jgi:AcrR family transcriptional regulator
VSETRHAIRRLPAEERRQAIVRAALRVFTSASYAGATTAEIAREAGVSEPVLYRHFASKRELWLACLDAAWDEARVMLEQKIAVFASGAMPSGAHSPWRSPTMPNLWIQGLTEAGEDPVVRRAIRRHMREVHDFVADRIRQGQLLGGIPQDRNPDAEAWVFIGGGLLRSVADRLGGVLTASDLEAISRERIRWLTGR